MHNIQHHTAVCYVMNNNTSRFLYFCISAHTLAIISQITILRTKRYIKQLGQNVSYLLTHTYQVMIIIFMMAILMGHYIIIISRFTTGSFLLLTWLLICYLYRIAVVVMVIIVIIVSVIYYLCLMATF